jgi:hypothetical protein
LRPPPPDPLAPAALRVVDLQDPPLSAPLDAPPPHLTPPLLLTTEGEGEGRQRRRGGGAGIEGGVVARPPEEGRWPTVGGGEVADRRRRCDGRRGCGGRREGD